MADGRPAPAAHAPFLQDGSEDAPPTETDDESRNCAPLFSLTMGEAWHNNHHAFPTSARHGLRAWQPDPSAAVISATEKTGLAWDVVRIPKEKQERSLR